MLLRAAGSAPSGGHSARERPPLAAAPAGGRCASLVFDSVGFVAVEPHALVVGAMVLIAIGLVGAVLAAILGLIDLSTIAPGTPARRTALTHMMLNLSAVLLLLISLVVRINASHDEVQVAAFILSLVAILGVGVSGWLGGRLAYRYGVRVAEETTQAEGFQ